MATGEERIEPLEIRRLREIDEFRRTLALQHEIWGFAESDQVPPRLMLVADRIGGVVLGGFLGERMVGFSLSMPGRTAKGESYLHSHMTGLLPEYQNRGWGKRIKWTQRAEALQAGYRLIEWTFDPLEIRNAHFNIERLGVIVRRYEPNMYGITSSRLHGGLPTDRLVAEWHLDSPRVQELAAGETQPESASIAVVSVPAAASALRASEPERALGMQTALREQLQREFRAGRTITGYRRTSEGGECLLT